MFRSITFNRAAAATAFIGLFLTIGTVAHAAPKVTRVTVSESDGGHDVDTFAPNTARIFVHAGIEGSVAGTNVGGKWIAVDTNGAAPPNYVIDSTNYAMKTGENGTTFSLSKPNNGFPAGSYRIDIYINGQLAKSAKFAVKK